MKPNNELASLRKVPGPVIAAFLGSFHKLEYCQKELAMSILDWYFTNPDAPFDWSKGLKFNSYRPAERILEDTFKVLGAWNEDLRLIGEEMVEARDAHMRALAHPPPPIRTVSVTPERLTQLCDKWRLSENTNLRDADAVERMLVRAASFAKRSFSRKDEPVFVETPSLETIELMAIRISREARFGGPAPLSQLPVPTT